MSIETSLPVTRQPSIQADTLPQQTSPQPAPANLSTDAAHAVQNQSKNSFSPSLIAQEVSRTVDSIKELAGDMDRNLQFHVDETTGKTVVTVRDRQTDEVIRQIPNEELLSMAQRLQQGGGLLEELIS